MKVHKPTKTVDDAPPTRVGGDMQDGMLAYYLEQAKFADANVEARIEKEPFDFRDLMRRPSVSRRNGAGN